MSVERIIASHLRLAAEDHRAAVALMALGNRGAVYHLEQTVEHMILALAQSEGIHVQRHQQHQLDSMLRLLPRENPVADRMRSLSWLEAYATAYRYPKTRGGLAPPPSMEKLAAASAGAGERLAELASHFAVDLALDAETPARNRSPPRDVARKTTEGKE